MLNVALGPYRIEAELGSGGMGTVYLARLEDEASGLERGARVAVKVIHQHLLQTPNSFKRFLLEAQLGQRVRHPNVVRAYDCDAIRVDGQDYHFLVMEHAQGQTLRALLDELGTVPEELCRHIGCEIAKGLCAIHEAGAVHRDLKPENVLITREHEVKIMDLGVARLLDDPLRLSRSGQFVGSVLYAPPEAFRHGGRDIDGRADLHSLGVLLYEIATGSHPYDHPDIHVALRNVLAEEPRRAGEVNPQLSPYFEEVIHKLCAKAADDRFGNAEITRAVLESGRSSDWWRAHARAITSRTRRPLRRVRIARETALYGREADLEILRNAYAMARTGDAQVLLVEGEAGVGKTRLIDEFVAELRWADGDINFLYGSYPPGGAATSASAFNNAFLEQFGAEGLEETLASYLPVTPLLVPAFAALLLSEAPPAGHEPLTKDSLQTVFLHALQGLAAERPTVVLIDDLHFAPDEGRALFAALALAVPEHRVLLIGAMRPGVPPAWVASVGRHEHAQPMDLRRLGAQDLSRLLEDAFCSRRLAAKLGDEIARKSDGNPFFVFEIVRSLRDTGLITLSSDGSWTTTEDITDIEIPATVADMVRARLAALDESDLDLLEGAACHGFRFDPVILARTLGLNELDVLRRLGRIERTHRLVRSRGRTCTFDHHQVQEFLYGGLSELLRERLHGIIADAMTTSEAATEGEAGGAYGAFCVDLCHHALRGGRPEAVRAHLDAALDHLVAGYLNQAAVALADEALAAPGLLRGAERCRVLLRKVGRLQLLGRREDQGESIAEALPLAIGTALESAVHRAHGELCLALSQYEEARDHFRRARRIARAHADEQEESRAVGRLGSVYSTVSRTSQARKYFEAAIALARRIGDRHAECVATGNVGLLHMNIGDYDEARRLFERHLAIAKEIGGRQSESIATGNLGLILSDLGRTEEARDHFARSLAIAREIGDRMGEAVARANLGMSLHALGRFDEACESYERCATVAREIGTRAGEANAAGNLGMVFYSRGLYTRAGKSYARSIAISREIGDRFGEGDGLSNLGTHEVALGCWDAARSTLEQSRTIVREICAVRPEGYALHGLALLAEEQDDLEGATALHAEAQAIWTRIGAEEPLAETLLALARLARRAGRLTEAAALCGKALGLSLMTRVPGAILRARVLGAQLPGGDLRAAVDALDTYESRAGVAERLEARWGLYELTKRPRHLQEALRLLSRLLENAPPDCRVSMRTHVDLHRRILDAASAAARVPLGGAGTT